MQTASRALLAAGMLLLAGCAAPPQAEQEAPAPAAAAAAGSHDNRLTGSRIPNPKTTDRVLRSVGQQEARNAMDSAPRPLDSR